MDAFPNIRLFIFSLLFLCLIISLALVSGDKSKQIYIVLVERDAKPTVFKTDLHWHTAILNSVSKEAEIVHLYEYILCGFSSHLTPWEAEGLEKKYGIIAVIKDSVYRPQTTRTPGFLKIENSVLDFPTNGASVENITIGFIDTGIHPESNSFNDFGMSSKLPMRWKGECVNASGFNISSCNNKLIGARYFLKGYEKNCGPINTSANSKSPLDDIGHGSHTSFTAAGSLVKTASFYGFASGHARGMAIKARIAVYKVCWVGSLVYCWTSDILDAMDTAVKDGVNILSISLGGHYVPFYDDPLAMGAFGAFEKGIFVACSAGNDGPESASMYNEIPWVLTIGAGTLDREFPATIILGNNQTCYGVSLYNGSDILNGMISFTYAGIAGFENENTSQCLPKTLDPIKVHKKIVLCDSANISALSQALVVKDAGGLGTVVSSDDEQPIADVFLSPAVTVKESVAKFLKHYIQNNQNPTATFQFDGTVVGIKPAPVVAVFSSRGPSKFSAEILKPNLIAPGVNILAAWIPNRGPSELSADHRQAEFNIMSGTSMSCPHVSGIAALLMAQHSTWTPDALYSALTTTATNVDNTGKKITDGATGLQATPFVMGAGEANPLNALDPGLIYDMGISDYIYLLCAMNYTSKQIQIVTQRKVRCNENETYSMAKMNFPSFAVVFRSSPLVLEVNHSRRLINVGEPAIYKVTVLSETELVNISVHPEVLEFTKTKQNNSFIVKFTASSMEADPSKRSASIEWSDGKHQVRSPIVFTWM